MADDSMNQDLLAALEGIQAELARINKTLTTLSAQKSRPTGGDTEFSAPRGRSTGYSRPAGRSEAPAGRYGAEPLERPSRAAGPGRSTDRKTPKVRSGPKPNKPLPPKKGNGYPKKPR